MIQLISKKLASKIAHLADEKGIYLIDAEVVYGKDDGIQDCVSAYNRKELLSMLPINFHKPCKNVSVETIGELVLNILNSCPENLVLDE